MRGSATLNGNVEYRSVGRRSSFGPSPALPGSEFAAPVLAPRPEWLSCERWGASIDGRCMFARINELAVCRIAAGAEPSDETGVVPIRSDVGDGLQA